MIDSIRKTCRGPRSGRVRATAAARGHLCRRTEIQERSSLGGAYERNSSVEGYCFHVDLDRRRYPQPPAWGFVVFGMLVLIDNFVFKSQPRRRVRPSDREEQRRSAASAATKSPFAGSCHRCRASGGCPATMSHRQGLAAGPSLGGRRFARARSELTIPAETGIAA